jgi:hypothetical protein
MKEKRSLLWRWCPQPERMKVTRTRPTDKALVPLIASALILSLLAIQGVQMWTPPAVNAAIPNSYGAVLPTVQPTLQTPTQTSLTSQTVTSVSTDHFTVQFTFPGSADPGNTITISTITTAKASETVKSLSIDVYAYVNEQLAKTTSTAVLANKNVYSGNTWQTTLTLTIPTNANRSVLVGTVTEVWQEITGGYYYGTDYWPYYNPYYTPYHYPHYSSSYPVNSMYQYTMEPSYVSVEKSSQQSLPLTYVLATTPEYEQLSAQHKELQQEYDSLVAKHNELVSTYESLRSDYDQLTSKYNQLDLEHRATTAELDFYKTITYVLIVITVALAGGLAFLAFQRKRAANQSEKQEKRNKPAKQEDGSPAASKK